MSYKKIELDNFYRKAQVEYFMSTDSPLIEVSVNVEITHWLKKIKSEGKSFYLAFLYEVCQAANSVPAFRQRIADGGIIEYDNCPCAYTVALENGSYTYNCLETDNCYEDFARIGREKQTELEASQEYNAPADGLRYLWFSSMPWVSFTNVNLPLGSKTYSEPIFIWGKIFDDNKVFVEDGEIKVTEQKKIPLTVMVNHALVDGVHIKQFLDKLEELLAE